MSNSAVLDGTAYASWAELREPKMDLLPGDITQAIAWFNDEFGIMPKLICLHSKCQHLAGEVPEGINIEYRLALAHEVLLSASDPVVIRDDRAPWYNPALQDAFFCLACLSHKPASEQSGDPRYCRSCCDFLEAEAAQLDTKHRGKWAPKIGHTIPQDTGVIMQTVNAKKSEVCIIQPAVREVTRQKRGPKQKALPVEIINQWASDGMGLKAIATRLKAEQGIIVHYSTISRILSGQRVML